MRLNALNPCRITNTLVALYPFRSSWVKKHSTERGIENSRHYNSTSLYREHIKTKHCLHKVLLTFSDNLIATLFISCGVVAYGHVRRTQCTMYAVLSNIYCRLFSMDPCVDRMQLWLDGKATTDLSSLLLRLDSRLALLVDTRIHGQQHVSFYA